MAEEKEKKKKEEKLDFAATIKSLEKDYGKGAVIKFGQKDNGTYDTVTTGSLGFDAVLGIGGWLSGKMYEMIGWEGTGKSTLCGYAAAGFQKKFPNKKVVYIDAEHALDVNYFKKLGVDTDEMYIAQPDYGEQGFNIAEKLIETGEVSLVIIDSDTSLKPKKEIDGDVGDSSMGVKARLNSQAYPKLHNKLVKYKTCVIVISQFREKIGVMFGSPETTSGGHALKFYSDVRMEIRKSSAKKSEEVYGNTTRIKTTKNKMFPPYRKCEFDIVFGEGIDRIKEIIDLGNETEIIKKYGKTITLLDGTIDPKDQVKYDIDDFSELLRDNEEFYQEIKGKILEKLKGIPELLTLDSEEIKEVQENDIKENERLDDKPNESDGTEETDKPIGINL